MRDSGHDTVDYDSVLGLDELAVVPDKNPL